MKTKYCSKCGQVKAVTKFGKAKAKPDGLYPWCRDCHRRYQREYRAANLDKLKIQEAHRRSMNRDLIKERNRAYRETNRELEIQRHRDWKSNNKDWVRQYNADYRANNLQSIRERAWRNRKKTSLRMRKWRRANRDKVKANRYRRRARLNDVPGYATPEQIRARWDYYGGLCYICGCKAEAIDHVKPLAAGGANWPCNLRPICHYCNSSKGSKWPWGIARSRQEQF